MADLEIIREHADGFTQQGHSVAYTDGYIKIRKSFHLKALRTLKGAPLSVFIEIALSDEPPTVQTICADTGYGSHAVCQALDYLVAHFFIEELGREGSRGSKGYRALSYTWSGPDRNAPPDADALEPPTPSGSRIAKNAIRHKRDSTPAEPVELSKSAIRRTRIAKRPVVVVGTPSIESEENPDKDNKQQETGARTILREAGIFGRSLDELADVDEAIAEAWANWISNPPHGVRNPQGIAVNALRADSDAFPPGDETPRKHKRKKGWFHGKPELAREMGLVEDEANPGWWMSPDRPDEDAQNR